MGDFDYFKAEQSDQFSFFRIPKALFTEPEFKKLSTDARLLYGILLDRISLSKKNGWIDADGHVYIIYTLTELQELMQMSHTTIIKLLHELDAANGIGLIERHRQGNNLASVIYVKNFVKRIRGEPDGLQKSGNPDCKNLEVRSARNWKSGVQKSGSPDFQKLEPSNTNINETDINDTEKSKSQSVSREKVSSFGRFKNVYLSEKEYLELKELYPHDFRRRIDQLSVYMKSSGKAYQNHFATICLWAERDGEKVPVNGCNARNSKYVFEEGECL